mmetsp:Transcript_21657/g.88346  ORF Transcript_21657/g.88346 Transcript_21657/m.88346 type:complete len:86 (-) Transcript_21657:1466-1723(-)
MKEKQEQLYLICPINPRMTLSRSQPLLMIGSDRRFRARSTNYILVLQKDAVNFEEHDQLVWSSAREHQKTDFTSWSADFRWISSG